MMAREIGDLGAVAKVPRANPKANADHKANSISVTTKSKK